MTSYIIATKLPVCTLSHGGFTYVQAPHGRHTNFEVNDSMLGQYWVSIEDG